MNQAAPEEQKQDAELDATTTTPAKAIAALANARNIEDLERIRHAVLAVGLVIYHWDIKTDELIWHGAVDDVIEDCIKTKLTTGQGYASLLERNAESSRYDAVVSSREIDQGNGVFFQAEYALCPDGPDGERRLWIEDCGRWFAGDGGQPSQVIGLVRRIDQRHEEDMQLRYLGNCDPLTGLINRTKLFDRLQSAMVNALEEQRSCAFFIAAISNLSVINDAYGYDIADDVIRQVAQRLDGVMRGNDAIGRYAGSKFGLILHDCQEDELAMAAERFLSAVRDQVIETSRGPVWATLSIGGLVLPRHANTPDIAMARAEEALYEAKRQSADSFAAFKPSAERISVRGLNARCATEIVSSLKNDRFALAYQPIVNAQTGDVAMYEALLRMICGPNDTVAASHLIPLAEKLGLVRMIDEQVTKMAVEAAWENPDLHIALNLSDVTVTDHRWCSIIQDIIAEQPTVSSRLMIEFTEQAALQDLDHTVRFIAKLRDMGCKVAIDDFGAGYTSFRNLQLLRVDMVKVDGSFCQDLVHNQDNQFFVRSLIDIARKFELSTAAECIESDSDMELLTSWGIDYVQGNLFGEAKLSLDWPMDFAAEERQDAPPAIFDATQLVKSMSPAAIHSDEDHSAAQDMDAAAGDDQITAPALTEQPFLIGEFKPETGNDKAAVEKAPAPVNEDSADAAALAVNSQGSIEADRPMPAPAAQTRLEPDPEFATGEEPNAAPDPEFSAGEEPGAAPQPPAKPAPQVAELEDQLSNKDAPLVEPDLSLLHSALASLNQISAPVSTAKTDAGDKTSGSQPDPAPSAKTDIAAAIREHLG